MSKTVIICSARQNESFGISGGVPGDQTGHEIERQDWYLWEPGGWIICRPKSGAAAEAIAWDMEAIADNDYIGYDQPRDQSLYRAAIEYAFDASKVKKACDTDCARAVRVCVLYAGIDVADFYTATERAALEATGAFYIIEDSTYTNRPDYLRRGDILVSRQKGHTVVVLTNGERSNEDPRGKTLYVTATANINLREAPRLSGKISGYMGAGDKREYTGCYAVDPRGVTWYEVPCSNDKSCGLWASSTYSYITEVK